MKGMWNQDDIATAFGLSLAAVRQWRRATTRTVAETIRRAGYEPELLIGGPVTSLSAEAWDELRTAHRLPPLNLPRAALPLPDVVFGGRTGWEPDRIRAWAKDTERERDGRLGKASPPGRPAGIVETVPRRRRRAEG